MKMKFAGTALFASLMAFCSCSRRVDADGYVVKDGLVYVVFTMNGKKVEVNTCASAYQQWSILGVDDGFVCFRSSDIGSCAYTLMENGTVQKRPALYLEKYGYTLYLLYSIDETMSGSAYGKVSDGLELVGVREETGARYRKRISGQFRYGANDISLSKDGLLTLVGVDSDQTIDLSTMVKSGK
ncbi:MAG: hypothetical protein ACI4RA_00270 [Kiritimatiellia bacterium]